MTSDLHVAVVGDAMLDCDVDGVAERLSPDAPVPVVKDAATETRAGGAGLAATLLRHLGHRVTLVTAAARDRHARVLSAELERAGVETIVEARRRRTPVKTRIVANGRVVARLDVEDDGDLVESPTLTRALEPLLRSVDAVLVSDYGAGVTGLPAVREFVAKAARTRPVVWDPHPAGTEPVVGTRVVTPNRNEASIAFPVRTIDDAAVAGERLRARWQVPLVVVTMGAGGAVLVGAGAQPFVAPVLVRSSGDACGAGDQFAAQLTAALAADHIITDAVTAAVRASARFVADGGLARMRRGVESWPDDEDPFVTARRVRGAGGTVVATSGCFDLLHAGHVASLEAARALGDYLVVCLNSDRSVRQLKGPGRPLVGAEDRRRVLVSLACVDAVVCFDEPTPERILDQLRPHVFAKGGDYGGEVLPEARVLGQWGGRAVIVPYLDGRSTTSLVEEVRRGAR